MLTVEQCKRLMAACRADSQQWLEKAYLITTKGLPGQRPVQHLILNEPQQLIHDAILKERQAGRPPRLIILKARQPGCSTLCGAFLTAMAWASPYTNSMILTHLDESSVKLLEKCTFALDNLPRDIKPVEKRRKTSLITLDYLQCLDGIIRLNSSIQVATASGKELWRGMTLHGCHMSEFARFPYPANTLGGIMQSVPKSPDSLVIIESTAQGEGDVFHNEWIRAEAHESDFVPIFIPWWMLPDARLPVPANFRMNHDEKDIQKRFKLELEQVVWYRYVLRTECQNNIDLWNQEYPDTSEKAFISTGRPAFPVKILAEMAERSKHVSPVRGEIIGGESGPEVSKYREGPLAIWKWPDPEHEYCIGADVAAGLEDGDYSCASVLDRNTWEIVASWHGHMSPIEWAHIVMRLGIFYNEAWLAPEVNNHGITVIDEIKRNFYKRVYVYQRMDKIRNTLTNFIGWETNVKTRGLMFDTMHWAISHHELMIWCLGTIKELREMRYVDERRAEGMVHDDMAIAAMIALRCHVEMPLADTGIPPRINLPDDKVQPSFVLPPLPSDNISKQAWKETDQIVRRMAQSRRRPGAEYVTMPDVADEVPWDPGEKDWCPEIPY